MPSMHWPWAHKAPPPPEPVNELVITPAPGTAAAGIAQYWKRNTLVLDLKGVAGSGSIAVRPQPSTTWPVRLAVRVTPGSIGSLEARAAQRVVLPIAATGTAPIDLELPPGVYGPRTEELQVSWGPSPSP